MSTSRLVIPGVDDDLKWRFKVICINRRSTMKAEIVKFIEKTVRDAEKAESK